MTYAATAAVLAIICYVFITKYRERARRKRRVRRRARHLGHQRAWSIFMVRPKLQRLEYRGNRQPSDKTGS